MADDGLTPAAGTGMWEVLDGRIGKNHERLNEIRGIQIEVCGRDGRNGKLQQLRTDVQELTGTVKTNQQAIQRLLAKQEKQGVKLTLLVGGAATVATMVGASLFKLLGG